jgi:hypothetical protein
MKRLAFFVGWVVCIVLAFAVAVNSAHAQTASSGSITGLVTDPQGGVVPGADVTLTDITTNSKQSSNTNDAGRYIFPVVNPGLYDVLVTKAGFKTAKMAQQKVSIGLVLTVNVTLEIGSLSETVVVTSSPLGSELQQGNATIGNTINLKQLELLPNLGRDATSLLALQPGVTAANAAGQGGGFVAGAYNDQNTFTVDGGNNSDDMAGNTVGYIVNFTGSGGTQTNGMASGVVPTPIESVEEFRVNTVGQTADFGNSIGAQVQMVTRRGSDKWHGSGYGYYFAPNLWGANTWANNHTLFTKGLAPNRNPCAPGTTYQSGDNNCVMPYTPIIPNHRQRFGFTVGGPVIPKKILGGKTYLFFNYEGFRYQNVTIFERNYPTPALRAGVIQVADAAGTFQPINLTNKTVTVQVGNPLFSTASGNNLRTVTLAPWQGASTCGTAGNVVCDPRGIGFSPVISGLWNTYLPVPNDVLTGDQFNTQGYLSTLRAPLNSDTYVGRIDHDFGPNHRFFASYRGEKLVNFTTNQVDVGGILAGGSVGTYVATAPRPQTPELLVFGLTSTLSPTITNDFRASYLWNWWQWSTAGSAPQPSSLGALGGALEIATAGTATNAEATTAMIPYNVNNQSVRQRVWDGQDKMLRDDLTWVKGNHVLQFGGQIQHNFDYHTRTDNGGSINNAIVYQIAANQITFTSGCGAGATPTCIPSQIGSAQQSAYKNLATSVLGLVGLTQVMYTRGGSDLHLLPLGTFGVEQSTIKTYQTYFSDTWKISRNVTLNYGLGYTYETPPVEKFGNQVALVYADGSGLVHTQDYLAKRKAAALAGTVYNPTLAFQTTNSLGIKYPYTPFKNGFSPRVSVAWNPSFKSGFLNKVLGDGKTVIRGGYGRMYSRLNGVNQVLVPLLGPGILQAVSCGLVATTGCLASGTVTPSNVFRIGTDGFTAPLPAASNTLPQPFVPGVNGNVKAGDSTVLDPDYRPASTDNVDFTIQHQFSRNIAFEVGYIGRRIKHDFQEIDLDAVPYMTTLGGQSFAKAYANLYLQLNAGTAATAVTSQPFFESALAKAGGTFCNGFANCTVAVASNATLKSALLAGAAAQVWNGLAAANSWVLPTSMISAVQASSINTTTALGYANYNAAFATLRINNWHDFSAVSNLTWGRALGTAALGQYNSSNTALDPWNMRANYGPQNFDYQRIFNAGVTYQPTTFLGLYSFKSKKGVVGQLLNGWSVSPFVIMQSGTPISVGYSESNCSGCQAFGETGNPGVASMTSTSEMAVGLASIPKMVLHSGNVPASGIGSNNPTGLSAFANPAQIYANFRPCILGLDTSCGGGYGNLRGLARWNMDATIGKDFRFAERIDLRFTVQFTNVLNHFQPSDPSLNLSGSNAATFGRITGQAYGPRNTEFGLRIAF